MSAPQSFVMKPSRRPLPESPKYANQLDTRTPSKHNTRYIDSYSSRNAQPAPGNSENGHESDEPQCDTLNVTAFTRSQSEVMPYTTLMKQPHVAERKGRYICLGVFVLLVAIGAIVICSLVVTLVGNSCSGGNSCSPGPTAKPEICVEPPRSAEPGLRLVYNRTCYCLYNDTLDWFQARNFCLSQAGLVYLAEIRHSDTNAFLEPLLWEFIPDYTGLWIGGNDLEINGVMKWNLSNTVVETFTPSQWPKGEPTGSYQNETEDCIEMRKGYGWNDNACNVEKVFLCESPLDAKNQCSC